MKTSRPKSRRVVSSCPETHVLALNLLDFPPTVADEMPLRAPNLYFGRSQRERGLRWGGGGGTAAPRPRVVLSGGVPTPASVSGGPLVKSIQPASRCVGGQRVSGALGRAAATAAAARPSVFFPPPSATHTPRHARVGVRARARPTPTWGSTRLHRRRQAALPCRASEPTTAALGTPPPPPLCSTRISRVVAGGWPAGGGGDGASGCRQPSNPPTNASRPPPLLHPPPSTGRVSPPHLPCTGPPPSSRRRRPAVSRPSPPAAVAAPLRAPPTAPPPCHARRGLSAVSRWVREQPPPRLAATSPLAPKPPPGPLPPPQTTPLSAPPSPRSSQPVGVGQLQARTRPASQRGVWAAGGSR